MLLDVAFEISTKRDVMKLGVKGLKMKTNDVQTSLQNNKDDISMAMHDVLHKWKASQADTRTAYTALCKVLKDVEMNYVTEVVLETSEST